MKAEESYKGLAHIKIQTERGFVAERCMFAGDVVLQRPLCQVFPTQLPCDAIVR